jgi:hypothetical protein
MGGVRGESKLFHAIVVVGLSLASTECGSSERSAGDRVADAANDTASTPEGPVFTSGGGDATRTSSGDGGLCGLDAASPDAKGCWPVYI